jgi:hypothetical protein
MPYDPNRPGYYVPKLVDGEPVEETDLNAAAPKPAAPKPEAKPEAGED